QLRVKGLRIDAANHVGIVRREDQQTTISRNHGVDVAGEYENVSRRPRLFWYAIQTIGASRKVDLISDIAPHSTKVKHEVVDSGRSRIVRMSQRSHESGV